MFTLGLSVLFGYYFFNVDSNNKCYVRDNSDYPEDARLITIKDESEVTNVSDDFDLLFSMFFV